jgi:hypothetical protein
MSTVQFVDVFVEINDNAPEGAGLRFKAEGPTRAVSAVELDGTWCALAGWSSAGGGSATAAHAAVVEDSGSGTVLLLFGDDWGMRITPGDGTPAYGEAYLLLDRETPIR